jgi:hypothetical protein
MTAIAVPKSPMLNRLEGFALTSLFQGFPTFAATVLMLRLVGDHQLVGHPWHATTFVLLATPIYALLGPWLGRRFPKTFKHGYEPLFFDPRLSFAEKIARWRTQPMGSLQLLSSVMLLSVLAVGVASLG